MAGVRLTDPLEQELLDSSAIEQVSVEDLRRGTPALFAQLDRLARLTDRLYIHIDLDVLDPREVAAHQNKVPGGPGSEELAAVFESIFRRYPTASAIGFATIPSADEGGLGIAAVNRMIAAAVRGVQARERQDRPAPRDSTGGSAYAGPAAPVRATRPCRIARIVDGDTVQCDGIGPVRLIGVDAPERDQGAFGPAAADALADLLPRGSTVGLEPDVTARDQFGRVLGYLWREGRLVNWEMVRRGWAVTLTWPPNVQYASALSDAERLAERGRVGLWAHGGLECRPADHRAGKC
jgi:endonuclease YncB( thermonuclease family)